MSTQLLPDHSGDEQVKKKKSAEFAAAMLELAHEQLGKKGKKKTAFSKKLSELTQLADNDEDPGRRSRQGAEDLLELVRQLDETHKKTSKTRRASDFLQPFVEGVTRYSAVVDTMVQSDPTVTSLVWGGVKFVLQLAVEFSQHYENLTKLLETLGEQLHFLGNLSGIFDWSEEVSNILIRSYKNILLLLEAAADAYGQSGFRTVLRGAFSSFDKNYKHLTERLDKNMQSVRDSVSAAQSYMLKKQTEDNEKRKLNEWLHAPMIDSAFRHCIEQKHPTTCQWLFAEPVFQNWELATSQNPMKERVVWIYGPPGIGKTFLASSIIQRLKENNQLVIFYYFRDEKSGSPLVPSKGMALTMLRYLARQLVDIIQDKRQHRLPTGFWDIHEKSGGIPLSDIESAVDVINHLLAVLPRIHIVVDGLDECTDRHLMGPNGHRPASKANSNKLLPTILERLVQSKSHGIVKWCFTSCLESDFLSLFNKLEARSLKLTPDHVREDVMEYVSNECRDNQDVDTVDQEAFISTLVHCLTSANFLDARLTLELLRENGVTTREELLESIWLYKDGFNERYLRGLVALAAKPKKEKELARRTLTFVTMAERPLTRNELLAALAVQPGSDVYSCDRRPKPEKFEELLAPLIELDRSESCSNPVVRFIHRTAKEFMQQRPDEIENLPPECRDFFADEDQKHEELGRVCLTYLTRQSFGFKSTKEMEKALCNSMDEDCNSFLRYASIFWYHHLSETSPKEDLFHHIARFMQSANFFTCLWVQSKWAPYQMARYTTEESKGLFHIENPTTVFLPSPNSQIYYADPLPVWLSRFNELGARLVQSCQLLIKEFGLVLLRRRGGIQHCHPCSLGIMNFLPREDEVNWRALALQHPEDARLSPDSRKGRHFISVDVALAGRLVIKTLLLAPGPKSLTAVTMREWQVALFRKKPNALKLKRENSEVLPFHMSPGIPLPEHVYAMLDPYDGATLSSGPDPLQLLRTAFEGNGVAWAYFKIPENTMQHPSGERYLTYRGRGYATGGDVSAVMYRWSTSPTYTGKEPNRGEYNKNTHGADVDVVLESDSDSDSDSEEGGDSDFHDSGYASDSLASSSWCTTIAVKHKDRDCLWYHFETTGMYLRQSPPVVHPTKPLVFLAVDSTKTVVINSITGEKKELHRSSEKHAVSRMYHFSGSGDKLYELITTRDFIQGQRWTVFINFLRFDVNGSNDVETVSITRSDSSSVSWVSPYTNPFDLPNHNNLPFKITWGEKHVFLAFGACEVYVVRMLLDPPKWQDDESAASSVDRSSSTSPDDGNKEGEGEEGEEMSSNPTRRGPSRVETTKKPVFLPASTTERPFTYIPHSSAPPNSSSTLPHQPTPTEKEYAVFVIAGSSELPPVLIRKDIDIDLGGWVSCDGPEPSGVNSRIIGKEEQAEEEEENDMKGKYSCNALTFHVPIRSGLAWDQRVVVECG